MLGMRKLGFQMLVMLLELAQQLLISGLRYVKFHFFLFTIFSLFDLLAYGSAFGNLTITRDPSIIAALCGGISLLYLLIGISYCIVQRRYAL